jgi:hypothetical protein
MKSTSRVRGSTSALTGFPFTVMESRTGMGFPFLGVRAGITGEAIILDNHGGRGNPNIHGN